MFCNIVNTDKLCNYMSFQRYLIWAIASGLFLLLLTPLIISSSLFFPYITGKAFFFRVIVEVVFCLWLLLAWREPVYRPQRSWIMWGVLALFAASALATVFGANPYRSFWSNWERMGGLVSYLHLLAYFLVISAVFRSEQIWRWFFRSSIFVSMCVAGYGLTQFSATRVDSTLGNATYLAVYMLFHIFLTAFLLKQDWKIVWTRYLYGLVGLLQILILYKTATRGAILGLLAGVGVTALCLLAKRWREPRVRKLGLGLLLVLLVIVAGFWSVRDSNFVKNSSVLSRFADISLQEGGSAESRFTIWQMSLRGFAERPLLGWGPENFELVFAKYFEPKLWRQEPWFDRSHNIFLDWLIDAGALGLLAYLSLFASALWYIWRSRVRDSLTQSLFTGLLAAYLVNNIFVFDNLVSYILFFSLLAYLHAQSLPNQLEQRVRHVDAPVTPAFWLTGGVLLVALCGAVYVVNIKPMFAASRLVQVLGPVSQGVAPDVIVSERLEKFRQIASARTLGSREAAEQLANQATQIAASPAVSEPLKQEISALAIAEMEREALAAPASARTKLILGTTYLKLGKTPEALEILAQAHELAPRKQAIIFALASAHLASGDEETALELAQQAFNLDEAYPEARKFYALALIQSGDVTTAGEILAGDQALELDDRFLNAYVEAKRYDLVFKLWQDKVKKEPGNTQFRFSLAAAYLMTNQRALAIQELETAAEIDPRLVPQVARLVSEIRAGRNPISQ